MTKDELKAKAISAISLGCDKNRVDLEHMLGRLSDYGFNISANVDEADIVIVNTCAFIEPAKKEAIKNILEMADLKKKGRIEKLIITGCFPERYLEETKSSFPEADSVLPLRENENICAVIENLYGLEPSKVKKCDSRILTSGISYAYLKIADGCDNVCSFCAIPRIRGRYKSVPIDELVDEAKCLAKLGVKELILVAQDTTRYGQDIYGENSLIKLCQKLCKIKGIEWIRLHYAYPELVTKDLLDFIVSEPKMCNYLDIPLQHIDNKLLCSMRRRVDESGTRELVDFIHKNYPTIFLRTTFIVGYPGEGRKDFKKLCSFIKDARFDFAGFFPYYREENTASYFMKDQVKNYIKRYRLRKITKLQNAIALERAKMQIGQVFDVLVDNFNENDGNFYGHTKFLSPLVDFCVKFVDNGNIGCGQIVKVKIFDFDGSNFIGEVL